MLIAVSATLAMVLVACLGAAIGGGAPHDGLPSGADEYGNDEDSGGDGEA